ncbi:MAG: hypothetical protein ACYTGO_18045, partial [Planctomycetota bacterium]
AVLCLRGIARFFKRSTRGVLNFFGGITDRVKRFFRACSRLVRRCADAVKDFLSDFTANVKRIPRHVARILRAILSWRPPRRTWTLLIALVAMGLGGFLIEGPAKELATGKSFRLQDLVTIGWLLAGLGMLLGGMGVFLQTSSYRRYFALAFLCSLPVAGVIGYQALLRAQEMRLAEGADRETLQTWVSGLVQLAGVFLGVAALAFFFLRTRLLKSMMCYGGPGAMGSGAVGAVQGGALAYLAWHVFRWLGFVKDIGWFVQAVYAVPIEYFVGGGAFLGALINGYFGFRRKTRPAEPAEGGVIGALVGSGAGYLAWILCQWLGKTKGIAWCATVVNDTRMEYFIGGGALLFCAVAVYRGYAARRGGGGPAGWRPRASTSTGTRTARPTVSSATRAAVSSGTRSARTPGTGPVVRSGTRPSVGSGTQPSVGSGTQPSSGTQSSVGSGTQPSSGTQSSDLLGD